MSDDVSEASSVYRVWCLSWDDDEDVGVEYPDTPSSGQRIEWALDVRDAVRMYAEYCHNNRDGWESTWPLMFRVRLPDGSTRDYEVDREMVPDFVVETDRNREQRALKELPKDKQRMSDDDV